MPTWGQSYKQDTNICHCTLVKFLSRVELDPNNISDFKIWKIMIFYTGMTPKTSSSQGTIQISDWTTIQSSTDF